MSVGVRRGSDHTALCSEAALRTNDTTIQIDDDARLMSGEVKPQQIERLSQPVDDDSASGSPVITAGPAKPVAGEDGTIESLAHFRAKWTPVRVKTTRRHKDLEQIRLGWKRSVQIKSMNYMENFRAEPIRDSGLGLGDRLIISQPDAD